MTATTTSREAILAKIRAARPAEAVAHPKVSAYPVGGDAVENFCAALHGLDGNAMLFSSRDEALDWLKGTIDTGSKVVFSAVDDCPGSITAGQLSDPHAANVVDVCIAEGVLGVGETGSVWVTDGALKVPAAALFSTDLYLLLDTRKIVDGIHEAYRRIDLRANSYGAFYSGPSATADIEAVHVTGAQGEITLTVLLY